MTTKTTKTTTTKTTTTTKKTKVIDFKNINIDVLISKLEKLKAQEEIEQLDNAKTIDEKIKIIQSNFEFFNDEALHLINFCDDFAEGTAAARTGGKWGFIKEDGTKLTDFEFDFCTNFQWGLARVKKGSKWGFIKNDGTKLTDFEFDFALSFDKGFATVEKNGIWGELDTLGNFKPTN